MSDIETIRYYDDALLSARDVESGYGKAQILFGVDLDVRGGEVVLVFGPNGAGKSTLIKAIYTVIPLWNGHVTYRNEDISDVPIREHVEHQIAYVPQRENIFPNLSVSENLAIGAETVDDPDERKEAVYDLFPELKEFTGREARLLSGGEKSMLALGRALMVDPDLLILDEPSAGLAPRLVEREFEHIRQINDRGTAILMIEQNVRQGLEIADRGYALQTGENRFEGPTDALLESDQIRDLYIGR
jgi:branched-chain amino acid transport system ATP-binding protein